MFYNITSYLINNSKPKLTNQMNVLSTAYARRKYGDPEYDDKTVEGLMRYFKFDTYAELLSFLVRTKKRC
jgi:hypothetical protein